MENNEEDKKITIDFDAEKMIAPNILWLSLAVLITVACHVIAFLFIRVYFYVAFLLIPGILLATGCIVAVPYVLLSVRRPLKRIEIDLQGKIRINDDEYDLSANELYFDLDDGNVKFIPFCCLNLNVMSCDKKRIRSYYTGPVMNKEASVARKKLAAVLKTVSGVKRYMRSVNTVKDEYAEGFGVIKIEFPAESIRNEFYKTGTLILVPGVAALVMSMLPDSFYGDDFLLKEVGLLRFITIPYVIGALIFSFSFYLTYRKLARVVEIREDSIRINDMYLPKAEIRSISAMNGTTTTGYDGEAQSWLFVRTVRGAHRFYLGQAKNGKCFEPRRKLFNSLDILFPKDKGSL
jgi:hypothetical protein